jgi:hypothetical protein
MQTIAFLVVPELPVVLLSPSWATAEWPCAGGAVHGRDVPVFFVFFEQAGAIYPGLPHL